MRACSHRKRAPVARRSQCLSERRPATLLKVLGHKTVAVAWPAPCRQRQRPPEHAAPNQQVCERRSFELILDQTQNQPVSHFDKGDDLVLFEVLAKPLDEQIEQPFGKTSRSVKARPYDFRLTRHGPLPLDACTRGRTHAALVSVWDWVPPCRGWAYVALGDPSLHPGISCSVAVLSGPVPWLLNR